MHEYVCVCIRERLCVCVRERERESEREKERESWAGLAKCKRSKVSLDIKMLMHGSKLL